MKHYVLGFVFNKEHDKVLLVQKNKPEWMKGRWNGIGGKIEAGESSMDAMQREGHEETHFRFLWCKGGVFICPGGTVFVFYAYYNALEIPFQQVEGEPLMVFPIDALPADIMRNLRYLIPLCLSTVDFFMLSQIKYGTGDSIVDG